MVSAMTKVTDALLAALKPRERARPTPDMQRSTRISIRHAEVLELMVPADSRSAFLREMQYAREELS